MLHFEEETNQLNITTSYTEENLFTLMHSVEELNTGN